MRCLFNPERLLIPTLAKSISLVLILLFFPFLSGAENKSDTLLIREHLQAITKTAGYRTYQNIPLLNKTADYIFRHFKKYADTVYFQEYDVNGRRYKNVVCTFGGASQKAIVVGAHYDVCEEQEGADDNASGVVGLLELCRLLKGRPLNYRIELVAYSLEEPPYFRTPEMGSAVHAKSLADRGIHIYGMISVEMIGYFKSAKRTQQYPVGILKWIYGSRGDYITLVRKFGGGKFARKFSRKFKHSAYIKTKRFVGPAKLPGIDFSDHLNYWKYGFSALMITDTAFYRNRHYHEAGDTMDTLDLPAMAKVIDALLSSLSGLK